MMFAQGLILAIAVSGSPSRNEVVWHWDRDTEACSLKQDSAAGESIGVDGTPGNDVTTISITSNLSSNLRTKRFEDGFIALTPGGKFDADVSQYVHDGKLEIEADTKDPTFLLKLSSAQAVGIGHGNVAIGDAPLKAAAAAADAIRQCQDQKMRAWGIDPVAWRALKSPPNPVAPLWKRLSDADYPMEAETFSVTGDAITRVDVGPDGRVQQCRSLNAGAYKGFESATCDALKGAQFRPALDSAGHPVSAPYVVLVHFRMPG